MNPSEPNPEFEAILDYLKCRKGCDLTGYKRASLMRRFGYRMKNLKIDTYQSYLQYLQSHSEEYLALLDDVLINVTSFFRDPDAWAYLATEIIPKIVASSSSDEPIRVWSAGCATGAEIYSVLIVLAEALGLEACLQRVQCYATDADEAALRKARQATYSDLELTGIPPELRQKYFVETEQRYVFHSCLRRKVILSRHDLTKDAPISRLDLLICRNVLIYFNPSTQASILIRFHFALKSTGFLFLGQSEMLTHHRQIFTAINLRQRVYAKGLKLDLEEHLSISPRSRKEQVTEEAISQHHFWQTAFETSPVAQLAIDVDGRLVHANEQANRLFGLTLEDWHQPFYNLKPGKLIAPHVLVKNFYLNRRPVVLQNIEWNTSCGTQYFDVTVAPAFSLKRQLLGSILTFIDKTDSIRLQEKLQYSNETVVRIADALRTTQTELASAHQEIQILTEDKHYKN